jgi:hypothetical protein
MTLLSANTRNEIRSIAAQEFSQNYTTIPIVKDDLQALIDFMDGQLETTEAAIFAAISPGDGQNWLLANQDIGRRLLALIEIKRQEEI